jgi:hypothetical protein
VIAGRLARVHERIRGAGGDSHRIRLVAVTKGFPPSVAAAAVEAGLLDLGENYAQELLAKVEPLRGAGVRWHLIGRLQRNKVRSLAPHVALWQSVDRPELAGEIARRAPGAAVLVQVDLSGEPQKGGCTFEEAPRLVDEGRSLGLDVRGLMGVAPAGSAEAARPGFARLAAAAATLGLPEVSMGMSGDLEVAVSEGATMVRVGTDLFGRRPPRPVGRHGGEGGEGRQEGQAGG